MAIKTLNNNSGQIIVEYVLLLVMAVSMAFIISQTITSRDPDAPGFMIGKWIQIWNAVGKDNPEKTN